MATAAKLLTSLQVSGSNLYRDICYPDGVSAFPFFFFFFFFLYGSPAHIGPSPPLYEVP
jgi:hypothetical protein